MGLKRRSFKRFGFHLSTSSDSRETDMLGAKDKKIDVKAEVPGSGNKAALSTAALLLEKSWLVSDFVLLVKCTKRPLQTVKMFTRV